MPQIGELSILLSLKGLIQFKSGLKAAGVASQLPEAKEGAKNVKNLSFSFDELVKNLKRTSTEIKRFGSDIGNISKNIQHLGFAITAGFSGAFIAAKTDVPIVDAELKKVRNSLQAVSDSIAIAALPSLQEFTKLLNGVSAVVQKITKENPKLVNSFLKFGAVTVVLGTIGIVISNLIKILSNFLGVILSIGKHLKAFAAVFLILGAVMLLFRKQVTNLIGELGKFVKELTDTFFKAFEEGSQRTLDVLGEFKRGFLSTFKSIRENVSNFAESISASLDQAFGDTLFNAITGRLKGLRSVLKSFGEDVLRAFTRGISNIFLGKILGTAEGTSGLLSPAISGIGSLFGFGKKPGGGGTQSQGPGGSPVNALGEELRSTTENLKAFQTEKDKTKSNFTALTGVLEGVKNTLLAVANTIVQTISAVLNFIVQGFAVAINNIISFTQSLFSLLGSVGKSKKGSGLGSILGIVAGALAIAGGIIAAPFTAGTSLGASLAAVGAIAGGAGAVGGGIGGLAGGGGSKLADVGGGGLAPGTFIAGPNTPVKLGPAFAKGGIVRKPTFATVGEAGPEAVVPLDEAGGLGNTIVINSDFIFANDPGQVDRFVRLITDGIKRASGRRTGGTAIAL